MNEEKKTPETTTESRASDWLSKENMKKILLLAFAIILMLVFFQKIGVVLVYLQKFWNIIFPFVFGASFAFVINVPMVQIENKFLPKKPFKGKRILAWLLTLILVLAVIAGAMTIVIPQIVETAKTIGASLQDLGSLTDLQMWVIKKFPQTESMIAKFDVSYKALVEQAMKWVQKSGSNLLNSGVGVVSNVVSGVATFFIGFAFSAYVLFRKEELAVQGKKVLYALFSEKANKKILDVFSLSYRTFSNFIRGQVLEAFILGLMFFITMSIFGMPYPLLCSVLIAITALIPIFGAFLGGGISALLILTVDPRLAVYFLIMFLVLQQIEGKLVYPHVVGSQVGLPGIWVLFAITVGGNLMGIAGMLIFVPLCSVLYALFREFVYNRLAARKVTPDKWALNPPTAARGEPIKVDPETISKLNYLKDKVTGKTDESVDAEENNETEKSCETDQTDDTEE